MLENFFDSPPELRGGTGGYAEILIVMAVPDRRCFRVCRRAANIAFMPQWDFSTFLSSRAMPSPLCSVHAHEVIGICFLTMTNYCGAS